MSKIKVDTITTKDGSGELTLDNSVRIKETSAPSQESGYGKLYVDSSSKNLKYLDSNDNTVDLTASSTGLTSLGGLTGATQTFGNDTNVTMVSSGTAHTLTWSGTLSHERGGLESDVSSHNGLVKISGGSTTAVTDNSTNWDNAYTHSQEAHAPSGAEANQNAFTSIEVNSTTGTPTNAGKATISSGSATDTLNIHAGDNVTLTHDGSSNAFKISSTDTTYSVGDGGLTENNFTNALKTKLDGITASADVTPAWVPSTNPNYLTSVATSNIDDDAVTYAKMQNMTTDRLLGRTTSSTGVVEELDKNAVLGLLNVSDGATANDTDANLKARGNHTGTQLASTISDFDTQVATTAVLKGTANAMSANIDMAKNTLDNARLQSYHETTTTIDHNPGGSSADVNINMATGNVFIVNITDSKNISGFNISNIPSDGNSISSFTLIINQPSSGTAGTIDFSSGSWTAIDDTAQAKSGNLKWQGGVEPTESNAVSKTDMYTFWTIDNGDTYYGCVAGLGW